MTAYALQSSNVFAYSFPNVANAHTSHIFVNNSNTINLVANSWTVEFWIKPDGIYNGYNTIFAKRLTASATTSYEGYLRVTSGVISFYNGVNFESSYRLTTNAWSHVAYVFNNAANLQIYVNGTNVYATTAVASITEVDAPLVIGTARGNQEGLYGKLSNFRMIKGQAIYTGNFNISTFPFQLPNNSIGPHAGATNVAASLTGNVVVLTCNDQKLQCNGNTVMPLLANGDILPFSVPTQELQNFSYYYPGNTSFQGQNGTVLVTNATNALNLNTADFTIETWFYPTSNTGVILERGYGAERNNLASYILTWDTPNSTINFAAANANNAVGYAVGGLTGPSGNVGKPTLNAWNHIAIARTGTTYRGFLNGTLNLNITTNANNPYDAVGRGVTIGGMFNNGQTFATGIPSNTISGYISNMRMIRGNSIYNAAFTPANTQLLNLTNVILLTGLTPAFEDVSGNHTLAVNGQNQIFFSTVSPFTSNAVTNGVSNLNMSSAASSLRQIRIYDKFNIAISYGRSPLVINATSQRQGKIYNKFDVAVSFGRSPLIPNATSQRQGRIYDKFDTAEYAIPTNKNYTVGSRQGRIYDKFDPGEYAVPININYTIGPRQGRIYNKFTGLNNGYLAYFGYPPSASSNANITYQFWS